MPGIAGLVSRAPAAACRRRLEAMLAALRYDPRYVSGTVEAPELGIYAGWVAIPGATAVAESSAATGQVTDLILAGECFDDAGSTATADVDGVRVGPAGSYRGDLDGWLRTLNGQFSGLLIDRVRGRACLFNDRYGAERLYVHEDGEALHFASEAKSLLRILPDTRAFDEDGVAQFLNFGCTLGTRTLFRGISLVEGASAWTFERGATRRRRYFTPSEWERQPSLSAAVFRERLEANFTQWLTRYVRGASRIGISLTGGLDSRMIMSALPALTSSPVCYTFAGPQGETLDARIGARVAGACGLEHHALRLGEDFLADYGRHLDRTVYATDGTAGATAAHEVYLNAKARALAPVRLTGNFGSEVLRGMSTFKNIGLAREVVASGFRPTFEAAGGPLEGCEQPVTFAAFREVPWKLFGLLAAARSQLTVRTPYLDNDLVALVYRAPSGVRQSPDSAMRLIAHGRRDLAAIPTDRNVVGEGRGLAYWLGRVYAEIAFKLDYLHQEQSLPGTTRLLAALARMDRFGLFGAHKWLPYRHWFRGPIAVFVRDALCDASTRRLPFWNARLLPTLADDHVRDRRNNVIEINAILTLSAIDRLLLRDHASVDECPLTLASDIPSNA